MAKRTTGPGKGVKRTKKPRPAPLQQRMQEATDELWATMTPDSAIVVLAMVPAPGGRWKWLVPEDRGNILATVGLARAYAAGDMEPEAQD